MDELNIALDQILALHYQRSISLSNPVEWAYSEMQATSKLAVQALIKAERQRTLDEVEGLLEVEKETEPPRTTRGDVDNYTVQLRNNIKIKLREQIKALKEK